MEWRSCLQGRRHLGSKAARQVVSSVPYVTSRRLLLQASATEINDVQWCPTNSTVFGSVTSNGRLEVRARARQALYSW